jgi:tRNA A37 threonylcarbamoyladenosine dehydratase
MKHLEVHEAVLGIDQVDRRLGLRQRLRKQGAPRTGRIGLRCVFSREPVAPPIQTDGCATDGTLNCAGYGSTVTVTATFGLVAAGEALRLVQQPRPG